MPGTALPAAAWQPGMKRKTWCGVHGKNGWRTPSVLELSLGVLLLTRHPGLRRNDENLR